MGASERAAWRASAIATGVASGTLLGDGRIVEALVAGALLIALLALASALVPFDARGPVSAIVVIAFSTHVAALGLLHAWSVSAGWGGCVTGDDAAYLRLALGFLGYLDGLPDPTIAPPYWGGEAYLFGTWVYFESALLYVFGPRLLVPLLANAAFAVAASLLVCDAGRRLFGIRAGLVALILVAFWPSLVVWSSLNLKDALTTLLVTLAVWGVLRFHLDRRWRYLAAPLLALAPLESLRGYIFVGVTLILPAAIFLTPWLHGLRRVGATAATVLIAILLIGSSDSGRTLGPDVVRTFELTRQAMAVGARTAFTETRPLVVRDGDSYVIAASVSSPTPSVSLRRLNPLAEVHTAGAPEGGCATTLSASSWAHMRMARAGEPTSAAPAFMAPLAVATPTATPSPMATREPTETPSLSRSAPHVAVIPSAAATPRVVRIDPAARLKVIDAPTQPPVSEVGTVYVRPGDIVVVGLAEATPTIDKRLAQLAIPRGERGIRLWTQDLEAKEVVRRTLEHLPSGLAHALFAPFPWSVQRALDLPAVAEMLAWDGALLLACLQLLSDRRRWRVLAPIFLFVSGTLLLLGVAEGNVGTLFRHRAMVIPFVLLLAAPILAARLGTAGSRRWLAAPARSDARTMQDVSRPARTLSR